MTHWVIIAEKPDVNSTKAAIRWPAFLEKAKSHVERDKDAQILLSGCFLLDRRTSDSTIGAILASAREEGIRYHVLEGQLCKSADADQVRMYDPFYQS